MLNIGNEYMSLELMEKLAEFYKNNTLPMPKRHYYARFIRDFREWHLRKMDFCHFTVPLQTATTNGFKFPGEYVGQYGVYEAVKHIYQSSSNLQGLVKDDHLLTNKRYFSTDIEKAVL